SRLPPASGLVSHRRDAPAWGGRGHLDRRGSLGDRLRVCECPTHPHHTDRSDGVNGSRGLRLAGLPGDRVGDPGLSTTLVNRRPAAQLYALNGVTLRSDGAVSLICTVVARPPGTSTGRRWYSAIPSSALLAGSSELPAVRPSGHHAPLVGAVSRAQGC